MADRCSISLTIATKDREAFNAANIEPLSDLFEVIDDCGHILELSEDEANYGYGDELSIYASKGLTFFGTHSSGDTYGASAFCCFHGHYHEVAIDPGDDNAIVCAIDENTGNPKPDNLSDIREYLAALKAVKSYFDLLTQE